MSQIFNCDRMSGYNILQSKQKSSENPVKYWLVRLSSQENCLALDYYDVDQKKLFSILIQNPIKLPLNLLWAINQQRICQANQLSMVDQLLPAHDLSYNVKSDNLAILNIFPRRLTAPERAPFVTYAILNSQTFWFARACSKDKRFINISILEDIASSKVSQHQLYIAYCKTNQRYEWQLKSNRPQDQVSTSNILVFRTSAPGETPWDCAPEWSQLDLETQSFLAKSLPEFISKRFSEICQNLQQITYQSMPYIWDEGTLIKKTAKRV